MNYAEQLEKHELLFSQNYYNGDLTSESKVGGYLGSVPLLISAPHSVNQYRDNMIKGADMYTGALALLLQKLTGCYCIFSTASSEEDPNYVLGGNYKNLLENVVKYHDIQYVIDLHGASESRDFDIDLGTLKGESIDEGTVSDFLYIFEKNNMTNVKVDDTFPALNPTTITSYSHKELGVQSVQMEIHRSYRLPENENKVKRLVNSLKDITTLLVSS